jgi:hypothetical protein
VTSCPECNFGEPDVAFHHAETNPWGLDGWCDACFKARRTWAWTIYRRALRDGTLVRPDVCERCERLAKITGHHLNYHEPLRVEWLCSTCHAKAHALTTVTQSGIVSGTGGLSPQEEEWLAT